MRTKYLLYGLAVMLAACNAEDELSPEQNRTVAQLSITTEIVTTRAFSTGLKNDVEFQEGNAIGFWLFDKNGKDYSSYTGETTAWNRKAVFKNSAWNIDAAMTLTDVPAKVVAYYPYKEVTASAAERRAIPPTMRILYPITKINIASFAHNDGQQDYLWAESIDSVDSRRPNARLRFKHVLPRITFEVQKGTDNADDVIYLRSAILKNSTDDGNTICTTGNLYENGNVTKLNETGQSIINGYTAPVLLNNVETRNFDFLVLPTEVAEGSVILSIEVRKGSSGNFQYYDIAIPATKWESGKQYTYPVTLNITEHQQESGETPGEKVYMGFNGDNGKPLYWSSWNLGAKKIEDYGGLYGWGDPTGEHKEHCYEYKKDDPYYMTDKTKCLSFYGGSSPTNNISGVWDYDTAKRLWGGNWRIPTQNEFNLLKSNCTYVWTTLNNVYGMKFTSKTNGNSIFLPYAPERYGNYLSYSEWNTVSGTYYQGSNYWSSNLNTDDVTRAHMFNFSNGNSCWIAKGSERYAGLPIRPVSD